MKILTVSCTMPACMAVLEELYEDFGQDKALFMPRVDNLLPCGYERAYYGFKTIGLGEELPKEWFTESVHP